MKLTFISFGKLIEAVNTSTTQIIGFIFYIYFQKKCFTLIREAIFIELLTTNPKLVYYFSPTVFSLATARDFLGALNTALGYCV